MKNAKMDERAFQLVRQALAILYDARSGNKERAEASELLTEAQNSPIAWQMADRLLRESPAPDHNSRYYAAHTMRAKIYYNFAELAPASQSSLRDSLLHYLSPEFGLVDHAPTRTQLALAVADMAVQMNSWENPIVDLVARLSATKSTLVALVDILLVVPDELNSSQLNLGENRRRQFGRLLESTSDAVLSLLEASIEAETSDVDFQLKILECFGNWLYLNACSPDVLVRSHLISVPFMVLSNGDVDSRLHKAAADCVCAALFTCEEEWQRNDVLATFLQPRVFALYDAYRTSVANEDAEHAVSLCRVFTEMGESFVDRLVATPSDSGGLGDLNVLVLVVECCKHPDYDVAAKTFHFWYRLADRLWRRRDDALWSRFRPHVENLLVALCVQCRFDDDRLPSSTSKQDDFVDFRENVAEVVRDVVFPLGYRACFKRLRALLVAPLGSWAEAEAILFVMQSIADKIESDDEEIVGDVLAIVVALPVDAHALLKRAGLRLIGRLAHWIDKHRDAIESILSKLVDALNVEDLAVEAALALDQLCEACREHLVPHLDALLRIAFAATNSLAKSAVISLIRGICYVITTLPSNDVTEQMGKLSRLAIESIRLSLSDENVDVTVHLDRLAAVFRYTIPSASSLPCRPVAEEAWPVLSAACLRFQADVTIMERWCRCARYIVRCLSRHAANLVGQLANVIVTVYASHPHSCFLYLAGVLVDEFGSLSDCEPAGFLDMLRAFGTTTFRLLAEADGFVRNPDTVDDLFRLCTRFALRLPVHFLSLRDVVPSVMECAIRALLLHHRDAHASVCRFLYELIRSPMHCADAAATAAAASTHEDIDVCLALLDGVVKEYGARIVRQIVVGCVGKMPRYTFADLGDIVWELMKIFPGPVSDWLSAALAGVLADEEEKRASSDAVPKATKEQLLEFHRRVVNAKEHNDLYDAISDLSRLFR